MLDRWGVRSNVRIPSLPWWLFQVFWVKLSKPSPPQVSCNGVILASFWIILVQASPVGDASSARSTASTEWNPFDESPSIDETWASPSSPIHAKCMRNWQSPQTPLLFKLPPPPASTAPAYKIVVPAPPPGGSKVGRHALHNSRAAEVGPDLISFWLGRLFFSLQFIILISTGRPSCLCNCKHRILPLNPGTCDGSVFLGFWVSRCYWRMKFKTTGFWTWPRNRSIFFFVLQCMSMQIFRVSHLLDDCNTRRPAGILLFCQKLGRILGSTCLTLDERALLKIRVGWPSM